MLAGNPPPEPLAIEGGARGATVQHLAGGMGLPLVLLARPEWDK